MIRAAIVGGTGYTGVELVRLLLRHPDVELALITSRAEEGRRIDTLFPNLVGFTDLTFTAPRTEELAGMDVVFALGDVRVGAGSRPVEDARIVSCGRIK